jgi:2-hydroxy fatty acid dioxygenase
MVVIKRKKKSPLGSMTPGLATLQVVSATLVLLIAKNVMRMKDVRDELGFYWLYHSHPLNQLVHFFFVPTLLWTLGIWMMHAEIAAITISLPFVPTHCITHATLLMGIAGLAYTTLDPIGGTLYLPFMYLMYGSAVWLHEKDQKQSNYSSWVGTKKLLQWSGLLHICSWAIQIYAHVHFEHGRPALLDSFAQSLTIAPLFAFYEGLWLLGINAGLQQETLAQASNMTKEFCTSGAPMHVCSIFTSTA